MSAIFLSELLGTMILLLFGCGTCMTVNLNKSFGKGGGWIVITFGWGTGVTMGALVAFSSGGHLNPAVTLGQLLLGNLSINTFFVYVIAQFIGAFLGALLAYYIYREHFKITDDKSAKLGVFATSSAVDKPSAAFLSQIIGTFTLVFPLLMLSYVNLPPNAGPFVAGLLVLGIGLATGGTDGYAINPARDLAPRFFHTIWAIPGKGDSHWEFAWVPLFGPIIGSIFAVLVYFLVTGVI